MTSRDSYRRPVSSEAALEELRRVAGTQLDPKVTAAFEAMILEGGVAFSHADEADFESELDTRSIKRRPPRTMTRVSSTPRTARQRGRLRWVDRP